MIGIRPATHEDAVADRRAGSPLEEAGNLRLCSREQPGFDIATFSVIVRDGLVIACNALAVEYPPTVLLNSPASWSILRLSACCDLRRR